MHENDPAQSRISAFIDGAKSAVAERYDSLKQNYDSLKQNLDQAKTVGKIGLLGLGISLGVVGIASAAEKPIDLNIPTLDRSGPEATSSDLQQDCVNAALKIKVKGSAMTYPGDRRKQGVGTEARLDPTSAECLPLITRQVPTVTFKMQRPNNHHLWTRTKPQKLTDSNIQEVIGDGGGSGTVHVTASGKGGAKDGHFLYRCTPGKGVTKVKAVYGMRVNSAVDGHTLAKKSISKPVKIIPIPASLVQGGGVPHAC